MIRNPVRRRLNLIRLAATLWLTYRRITRLQKKSADAGLIDAEFKSAGAAIRETGYTLRGVMVKAGQFLSMRQDLFPRVFTDELQGLQDDVPAEPITRVRKRIEQELGKPMSTVFAEFDEEPIASGSIAQVHRAVLTTGETVAVKVLRPGIERLIQIDLSTIGLLVKLLSRLPNVRERMDFQILHQVFQDSIGRELNMNLEAKHMERFQSDFAEDTRIHVPRVYGNWVTSGLLVMEYVRGTNVRDVTSLGEDKPCVLSVRDALLDAYVRQIFVTGFVHLDPHPGNLSMLPDGRLAFLDFGMVAMVDDRERALFRQLIQQVLFHNIEGVVEVLLELGYLDDRVNRDEFVHRLEQLGQSMDVEHLRGLLQDKTFHLQAKYMLLIRCIGLLKSVLQELSPEPTRWMDLLPEHIGPVLWSTS